jgi:hypothetical protein
MPCILVHPKRNDPFPQYIFQIVPNCKHVLIVTRRDDVLTRSFCNDIFGNEAYTFVSLYENDPNLHEKVMMFVNTYTQDSICLFYN